MDDLWESHAEWWIEGFTEGADPEYEEQILPLAAEYLAGARRVLDIGTGDGQVARLAVRTGAERSWGRGCRVVRRSVRGLRNGGGQAVEEFPGDGDEHRQAAGREDPPRA